MLEGIVLQFTDSNTAMGHCNELMEHGYDAHRSAGGAVHIDLRDGDDVREIFTLIANSIE